MSIVITVVKLKCQFLTAIMVTALLCIDVHQVQVILEYSRITVCYSGSCDCINIGQ
jgi:hypothetical protein